MAEGVLVNNQPPEWVSNARTAATQNKKVLAVEGKTDVAVYGEWLEKQLDPVWANQVHLENALDRPRLLSGLRCLQETNDPAKDIIFGLADRDEWETDDITALQARLPTLLVNQSRHSLESCFCDPDEIEATLNSQDTASGITMFGPRLPNLRQQIENARRDYVPNWAFGHVIQRANENIRTDAQYPTFFRDTFPLPPDPEVLAKLEEWAGILEPNGLFAAFDNLRTASLGRPVAEQFRSCIESKLFFGTTVIDGPHGLNSIQRKPTEDWKIELARWSIAMPADLQATLTPVLT